MPRKYRRLTPVSEIFEGVERIENPAEQFNALREFIRTQGNRNLDEMHPRINAVVIRCLLASEENSEHRAEIGDFINEGQLGCLGTNQAPKPVLVICQMYAEYINERTADVGAVFEIIRRFHKDDPLARGHMLECVWKIMPASLYSTFGRKLQEYGDFLGHGQMPKFIDLVLNKFRIEFELAKLDTTENRNKIFVTCENASWFLTRERFLWILMARTPYILLMPPDFGWRYAMTLAQVGFSPNYEYLSVNQERIEPLIDFLKRSLPQQRSALPEPNFPKIELALQLFANFATLNAETRAKLTLIIPRHVEIFGELAADLQRRIEVEGDFRDRITMENMRNRLISLINWETLMPAVEPSFGSNKTVVTENRIARFFQHAEAGRFFYEHD